MLGVALSLIVATTPGFKGVPWGAAPEQVTKAFDLSKGPFASEGGVPGWFCLYKYIGIPYDALWRYNADDAEFYGGQRTVWISGEVEAVDRLFYFVDGEFRAASTQIASTSVSAIRTKLNSQYGSGTSFTLSLRDLQSTFEKVRCDIWTSSGTTVVLKVSDDLRPLGSRSAVVVHLDAGLVRQLKVRWDGAKAKAKSEKSKKETDAANRDLQKF